MGVVTPADPVSRFGADAVDAAVEYIEEAERLYRLRTWAIGEEWGAVIALRAGSFDEYVCGLNLSLAVNLRGRAERNLKESESRRPSGRRLHTAADAQDLRDRWARNLERAEEAEAAAARAIGARDADSARRSLPHLDLDEIDRSSGSSREEWDAAMTVAARVRVWQAKRQRWGFVRGRAEQASQPTGGLIPLSKFDRFELGGAPLTRRTESGNAGTISSAVELIARWDLASDSRASEDSSSAALAAIRAVRRGEHTESSFAQIAVAMRSSYRDNDRFEERVWKKGGADETLAHIAEMRERVSRCFERFGRPIRPGTWPVLSERFGLEGHIDFVAADTIWDLKVSATPPTARDILQLLLYWLTFRDDPENGRSAPNLGIYNPRLDVAWRLSTADIPPDIVTAVERIALSEHH